MSTTSRNYIYIGAILIFICAFWRIILINPLSFRKSPTGKPQNPDSVSIPVSLKIPKLQIDLPVVETKVTNGVWEVPDNALGHLSSSGNIGKGNMVIYGHNKNQLLGRLPQISIGDVIKITGNENTNTDYLVTQKIVVSPADTAYVMDSNEVKLTLYTCSGFLDLKRLIIVAKFMD